MYHVALFKSIVYQNRLAPQNGVRMGCCYLCLPLHGDFCFVVCKVAGDIGIVLVENELFVVRYLNLKRAGFYYGALQDGKAS